MKIISCKYKNYQPAKTAFGQKQVNTNKMPVEEWRRLWMSAQGYNQNTAEELEKTREWYRKFKKENPDEAKKIEAAIGKMGQSLTAEEIMEYKKLYPDQTIFPDPSKEPPEKPERKFLGWF